MSTVTFDGFTLMVTWYRFDGLFSVLHADRYFLTIFG